jgi:hypothetical protein
VNWDSALSKVTTLQAGRSIGSNPGKDKRFSLIQNVQVSSKCHPASNSMETGILFQINPLPALMYQNVLDLNVACRAKHTQTYWHIHKFKCPLKKMQPSCPCSRDLNWTGKGLKWPGCDFEQSAPTTVKVMNEWSYIFTPPDCLHDLYRENFTFSLFV